MFNLQQQQEPASQTDAAKTFWYGGKSGGGGNRWFDKSIQLICTKNGKVAYLGEHSMLDAAPVLPMIRRILKTSYNRLIRNQKESPDETKEKTPADENNTNCGVSNIFADCWKEPTVLEAATELTLAAKKHHEGLVSEYDVEVMVHDGIGKKFLKKADLVCHDFVQMAMQLASYRLFDGKQVGTYEAALTRKFRHGRTETTRPVSPQSHRFVECMGRTPHSQLCTKETKMALLREAVGAHNEYQANASNGLGVDRHFFGLSNMLERDEAAPALFSHPLFLRSKTWQLSTSSVIFTPGFGPSAPDGIAVGYRVEANSSMFTCTSRTENGLVRPFCALLQEALEEMGELVKDNALHW